MTERSGQSSSYLDYLPAIYQQDATVGEPNFLGRFLLAFEHLLSGLGDAEEPGLEEILDGIRDPISGQVKLAGVQRYFIPGPELPGAERVPTEFLNWLAGWVALTLRGDLDELRQREFIARAVSLYALRGTKQGIQEIVRIYTRLGVLIDEGGGTFQLGIHSTIGEDTILEGGAPHFFRVLAHLPTPDPAEIARHREVITAILDLEKPAHTFYELRITTPSLQIGVHSTIGEDTLLSA